MARLSTDQRLANLHSEALEQFDEVQTALRDERLQCLQDRRFYSLAGSQWEGPLADQFENKPRFEVNKIHLSVIRIINEYRNNRITVDFVSKDGVENDKLAEVCDGLYRSDENDSVANEAYDNAFEEAVGGGYGAWRLRAVYEDEENDEDDRQRIRIEPIFDADSSVFFDLGAKRQDKSDAKYCFVVTSMTRQAYKDTWGDDPTDWPKIIHQYEFDWCTPDVVYVAEYYKVEEKSETIRIFQAIDGSEERYSQADFEQDETLEETLSAVGSREIRQKRVKRKKVRKYIMSGGRVLEDAGYIAGKCIPIVAVFGKRWFVDNIERCMGHVRLAKDAQRLKNMQLSKLGEISALSSIEKPILTPEQVAGHQMMWAEDNLKDYPYLLVNPITGPNGEQIIGGPVAYTKSAAIPPAMAALLQITEQDMQEILGNPQGADKMVSNISGKAVEMIQARVDMQTFIYLSNFAKGMKRCGEIWLSMARDVYTESKRKMKTLTASGETDSVELMQPSIDQETGEMVLANDLSSATFDVNVDVGPSSSSKKAATVRALTGMMQITQDPETLQVLGGMAMMNMEGEGISDANAYYRKKLLRMGVIKPTDKEAEEMQAEMQGQPQDPQTMYLQAAAEEASAKAAKARADTVETIASAELKNAQTMQTFAKISEMDGGEQQTQQQPAQQPPQQTAATPANDAYEFAKKELELENLRIDTAIKLSKLRQSDEESVRMQQATQTDAETQNVLMDTRETIKDAVDGMKESINGFQKAIEALAEINKQNAESSAKVTEQALDALKKPKRVVREKGRIVGIE